MKSIALSLFFASVAFAQLTDEFRPARAACCLPNTAQSLADQLQDWNQLGRYHADNVRLRALPQEPKRVVFMGDSITDGWKLENYFPGKPYVNRGIGGQTTPQMVVRMFPDVIHLKPAAMVVLAGTNDIARNTGPVTFEMITNNYEAMADIARAHGIKVILCSILPISDYTQRKQSERRPPAEILRLNRWLREYAARTNAIYVDYHAAAADEKGMLKEGTSNDGLHPNDAGYKIMVPLVEAAIQRALQ
ncbi:MAG: SGNH/GDSL hydrolase family protein [Candidatus Solibacter usitatus]|nr:SGNH/GDSL hydrolase family protein [Candidatus Solibacter usitatus]